MAPAIAANEGYDEIDQILNADDFLRAYIEELLPNVPEGRIEPGRVFDREGVPDGYRAMNAKLLIHPFLSSTAYNARGTGALMKGAHDGHG